jgi:hypothetical protein
MRCLASGSSIILSARASRFSWIAPCRSAWQHSKQPAPARFPLRFLDKPDLACSGRIQHLGVFLGWSRRRFLPSRCSPRERSRANTRRRTPLSLQRLLWSSGYFGYFFGGPPARFLVPVPAGVARAIFCFIPRITAGYRVISMSGGGPLYNQYHREVIIPIFWDLRCGPPLYPFSRVRLPRRGN